MTFTAAKARSQQSPDCVRSLSIYCVLWDISCVNASTMLGVNDDERQRQEKTHHVERRASPEPPNLALIVRMCQRHFLNVNHHIKSLTTISRTHLLRPVRMLGHEHQVLARRKRLQTTNIHPVVRLYPVIIRGIGKRQRKHAVLFQVRLMNPRKRAHNDREAAEIARLERGLLARGPLPKVVFADDDPSDPVITVVGRRLGDAGVVARDEVLDLIDLAIFYVDGAD